MCRSLVQRASRQMSHLATVAQVDKKGKCRVSSDSGNVDRDSGGRAANHPLDGAELAPFSVSSVAILLFSLIHTLFLVSYLSVPKASVPEKDAIPGGWCASAVRYGRRCGNFAHQGGGRDCDIKL